MALFWLSATREFGGTNGFSPAPPRLSCRGLLHIATFITAPLVPLSLMVVQMRLVSHHAVVSARNGTLQRAANWHQSEMAESPRIRSTSDFALGRRLMNPLVDKRGCWKKSGLGDVFH